MKKFVTCETSASRENPDKHLSYLVNFSYSEGDFDFCTPIGGKMLSSLGAFRALSVRLDVNVNCFTLARQPYRD